MNQEVAVRTGTEIAAPQHEAWLHIYEPLIDLAGRLANSPFAPAGVKGDAAAVFSVILAGHGMGLHPIASLQSITLIQGQPYVATEVYLGLAYRAGHSVHWGKCDPKSATVRVTRGDGLGTAETTYTIAEAQAAGLMGKKNWKDNPGDMLRARAVRRALKMTAPDLMLGLEPEGAPAAPAGLAQVVQLEPPTVAGVEVTAPPAAHEAVAVPPETDTPDGSPLVTDIGTPEPAKVRPAQMRKLQAALTDLERRDGARMSRDERRLFIAALLQLPELGSASDLTEQQASTAIDAITELLKEPPQQQDEPELVEDES
jgi:hypothetical protein